MTNSLESPAASNDPLHGKTLEAILNYLVEKMGWDGSFRGRTVQPAVFVWYAEVLLANGELVLMKGDVTVVD